CGETNNACLTGTLDDISDETDNYLWQCLGSNSGINDSCSLVKPIIENGSCGTSINECLTGTLQNIVDNSTYYLWN
ncbi:hypothetical protein M3M33_17615, partial [Loigolactobacillus coryniformis]|uniref:hypothetical protein n=1 Tax=Loigolactobacillus coryniformis TaxID=1610 RepID=UPI00201AE9A8